MNKIYLSTLPFSLLSGKNFRTQQTTENACQHDEDDEHDIITSSLGIRRTNVGSHAIIFKNLSFGPFTLKCNPGAFKLKQYLQCFRKSPVLRGKNTE